MDARSPAKKSRKQPERRSSVAQRLAFASSNPEKLAEVRFLLAKHGIRVDAVRMELHEPDSGTIEEVAAVKARNAFKALRRPAIAEDTAIFFNATPGFPGLRARRAFEKYGLDGLLKMLEGKARGAKFKTCVAYCESASLEPRVFIGICRGRIARHAEKAGARGMKFPYERIFVPCEIPKPLCRLTAEEKALISHRSRAFSKFANWFKSRR